MALLALVAGIVALALALALVLAIVPVLGTLVALAALGLGIVAPAVPAPPPDASALPPQRMAVAGGALQVQVTNEASPYQARWAVPAE